MSFGIWKGIFQNILFQFQCLKCIIIDCIFLELFHHIITISSNIISVNLVKAICFDLLTDLSLYCLNIYHFRNKYLISYPNYYDESENRGTRSYDIIQFKVEEVEHIRNINYYIPIYMLNNFTYFVGRVRVI